jgi:hypothetical protein
MFSLSYLAEEPASLSALETLPPRTRAYVQHFERGLIIYMRAPRTFARDQWFVLYFEEDLTRYWSFVSPASLLGTEAPAYRPNGQRPPPGFQLPAVGFGRVWIALKDLLGWAMTPVLSYYLDYQHASGGDPFAPPSVLPGPEGMSFLLYPDRTWDVDIPEDSDFLT